MDDARSLCHCPPSRHAGSAVSCRPRAPLHPCLPSPPPRALREAGLGGQGCEVFSGPSGVEDGASLGGAPELGRVPWHPGGFSEYSQSRLEPIFNELQEPSHHQASSVLSQRGWGRPTEDPRLVVLLPHPAGLRPRSHVHHLLPAADPALSPKCHPCCR